MKENISFYELSRFIKVKDIILMKANSGMIDYYGGY